MKMIMKEIKEDVEALEEMDRKIREEARKRKENMEQINEAEEEDAEALEEMERKIREWEELERKKKKLEINKILAGLFSELNIK